MGITGHLLLASDAEIEALVQHPSELYSMAPSEEPDPVFRVPVDRFQRLADLNAMAWILSGEYPGALRHGPDRPIAFLTRGGTGKRIDGRVWVSGPVMDVHEARVFSVDELDRVAASVCEVGEGIVSRKGGEAALGPYRDLRDFLNAGVEKRLLLLISGSCCFLFSEAELQAATGSADRARGWSASKSHPWLDLESNPERHVNLDKLWDAMCRLLEASDSSAGGSWALFEHGGVPIGGEKNDGFGYGPARGYRSPEVMNLSERLSRITETSIGANLDVTEKAYRVARKPPDDYVDLFRKVRTLLERGVAGRRGMLAYFT